MYYYVTILWKCIPLLIISTFPLKVLVSTSFSSLFLEKGCNLFALHLNIGILYLIQLSSKSKVNFSHKQVIFIFGILMYDNEVSCFSVAGLWYEAYLWVPMVIIKPENYELCGQDLNSQIMLLDILLSTEFFFLFLFSSIFRCDITIERKTKLT